MCIRLKVIKLNVGLCLSLAPAGKDWLLCKPQAGVPVTILIMHYLLETRWVIKKSVQKKIMAFYMKTIYGCIGEAGSQQSVALIRLITFYFIRNFWIYIEILQKTWQIWALCCDPFESSRGDIVRRRQNWEDENLKVSVYFPFIHIAL